MSSSVPPPPNHLPLSHTAKSAEEHCVALALHLCSAAAVYLVYDIPGQLPRQWKALRQQHEPNVLCNIPSWAMQLGDEALVVIPDTLADARIAKQLHNSQAFCIRSVIRMRISQERQSSGTLWVFDTVPRGYSADDLAALGHLLQIMAAASAPTLVLLPTSMPDESSVRLRVNETALQAISQGVIMTGLDRRILFVNNAFSSITGYHQSEIQGQSCQFLQGPLTDLSAAAEIRRALDSGAEYAGEILNYRKDGTPFWNDLTITPVRNDQGQVTNFVGIVRDITERKQAQAALITNETRLRAIIDASPVPMGLNDEQQQITFLNPAFTQTFGYTNDELPTLTQWWEAAYPDRHYRQWVTETWHAELERMQHFSDTFSPMEVNVRCKDGTNKTILASAAVISYTVTVEYLVVLYDITAQKHAEVEQDKLKAQLYQAQKMDSIGRLAGGVAHDFNNMLGVILGYTELALEETNTSPILHTGLMETWKAAQRSANLTRQLLAFARKQAIIPKVLDLNETVAGTLMLLQRMIGENIELAWKPAADLWPIKMDPTQIDQILANLCINARDAIANIGKITIETAMVGFEEGSDQIDRTPGEYVLLSVRDTGCGMDSEVQEHLFEPFFTTKPPGEGTGLGLSTVYGIVKQNNGFINVSSELGQGTTFNIYLPRHTTGEAADQELHMTHPLQRGGETILLVEDEPAILKLGSTMLTRLGYHVLTAKTPRAAIHLADLHVGEIHLLMTDVVMPEMNGHDLASYLLIRHPRLKRLFMSGYHNEIIAHFGLLADGESFIQKPFSTKDLAFKVREILDY